MTKKNFLLLLICYSLLLTSLFFYSFTQLDLNLTLSQASILQSIEKFFIQIGYFQRPLSTVIFLLIISGLFIFYLFILQLASKNKISKSQIWWLAIFSALILLFSYPAFSHDIFNYMFDARIFTKYQLNPYFFKPLDFSYDPWTRFMHWTHRNYPYGPSWLIATIPLSYLGFGKFLLTLLNFKILMAVSYLGTAYLTGKILAKINSSQQLLGMAFFALNPLVIIESLVSAHHDIVMMFFTLLAIYLLLSRKKFYSLLAFAVSFGVKFVTAPLAILFILGFRKNLAVILSALALLYVASQREIQPWYFLWVLTMVALVPENRFFTILTVGFSLGLLLRYAPFLYFGDWNAPVPKIETWVTILPIAAAILVFLLVKGKAEFIKSKS